MAKCIRKTPVEEAFQWFGDQRQTEDPIWIIEAMRSGIVWFDIDTERECYMVILSPFGKKYAKRGDYIVKTDKGELKAYTPAEFKELYHLAPQEQFIAPYHYDEALGKLREARALLLEERADGRGSRELSTALTEIDTAILWRQEDIRLKQSPVNEVSPW